MARKVRIEYAGAFYHILNRGNYRDSSFHQLWHPRKRWAFSEFNICLESAGGLADKPKGRKLYRDYLDWLSEHLNMGTANSVSSLVSRHKASNTKSDKAWKALKNQ